MKTYITFGQTHIHSVNEKILDHDSVAVIEATSYSEAREKAFELFRDKWCFAYSETEWTEDHLSYFPRGLIYV